MAPPPAPAGWYPDPDDPANSDRGTVRSGRSRPSHLRQSPPPKAPSPNVEAGSALIRAVQRLVPPGMGVFQPAIQWMPVPGGYTLSGAAAAISGYNRMRSYLKCGE